MTTDTAPLIEHAIPTERLAPLLHDRVRVCEVIADLQSLEQCERPAEWVVTYRCTRPEHERAERLFTCSWHMAGAALMKCGGCRLNGVRAQLLVINAEPIR